MLRVVWSGQVLLIRLGLTKWALQPAPTAYKIQFESQVQISEASLLLVTPLRRSIARSARRSGLGNAHRAIPKTELPVEILRDRKHLRIMNESALSGAPKRCGIAKVISQSLLAQVLNTSCSHRWPDRMPVAWIGMWPSLPENAATLDEGATILELRWMPL